MALEADARARFAELVSRSENEIELDHVALTVARGEYPGLDVPRYLRRLDDMAAEVRPRLSPEVSPRRLIATLNEYLFGEQAFHGNALDYYDPRNSYLNDVMDRNTGIPITLSLLYIELARRVGLRLEGVGLPGHFIVRYPLGDEKLLVDPFNAGAMLTLEDCADRVRQLYGNSLRFSPDLLRPASRREIVRRLLANLKGCYLRRGDLTRALRAVDWTLLIDPAQQDELREKGLLRFRLGDFKGAAADLERFLQTQPSGRLADQTRSQLRLAEDLWIRRN